MGLAAAGGAASIAGGMLGNAMNKSDQPDIGEQITNLVNQMNNILQTYTQKGIDSATNYTNQAIGNQNQALNTANNNLTNYLQQATQQAQQQTLYGLQTAQAYAQPAISAGNTALDSYMDSLGLSRPTVGYGAIQSALVNQANQNQALGNLGKAPSNPGTAPTAPGDYQSYLNQISNQQVQDYVNQNLNNVSLGYNSDVIPYTNRAFQGYQYTGAGSNLLNNNGVTYQNDATRSQDLQGLMANSGITDAVKQQLAQQQYQQAQQQYNTQNNAYQSALQQYNNYNNQVAAIQNQYGGNNPQQQSILNAYNSGLFGGGGAY